MFFNLKTPKAAKGRSSSQQSSFVASGDISFKHEDKLQQFLKLFQFESVEGESEDEGWTPFRFAVMLGDVALLRQLVRAGVSDLEAPLGKGYMAKGLQKGSTIFTTAAIYGTPVRRGREARTLLSRFSPSSPRPTAASPNLAGRRPLPPR